jgi:hypothetical protein
MISDKGGIGVGVLKGIGVMGVMRVGEGKRSGTGVPI